MRMCDISFLKRVPSLCDKYLYAMVPYVITEEELVKVLTTMKAWFKTH